MSANSDYCMHTNMLIKPVTFVPLFIDTLLRSSALPPPCHRVYEALGVFSRNPRSFNPHSKTAVSMIILSIHALLHPCPALSNLTLRNPSVFLRPSVRPHIHGLRLRLHERKMSVPFPCCNPSYRSNLFFCHIKITQCSVQAAQRHWRTGSTRLATLTATG